MITEYYPVPEKWFWARCLRPRPSRPASDRLVVLGPRHLMEGDASTSTATRFTSRGSLRGWVNRNGRRTELRTAVAWTTGCPYRAGGYWKSAAATLPFPLDGRMVQGEGARYFDPPGGHVRSGMSRPLDALQEHRRDPPDPMGSKVYIPQYKDEGGWFKAADPAERSRAATDVFRSPPASLDDKGQYFPDVPSTWCRRANRPKGAPPGVQNPAPARTPRRAPAPTAAPARPEEPRVARPRCAATSALALPSLGVAAPAAAASDPAATPPARWT